MTDQANPFLQQDEWETFREVNFSDKNINQYHVDTRDFCCITNTKKTERDIDFAKLKKYPDRFLYTPEEIVENLNRLFEESGGKNEWRYLSLEGDGQKLSENWELKYIRIYRINEHLVVCNNVNYAISKEVLSSKVNQHHLHAQ